MTMISMTTSEMDESDVTKNESLALKTTDPGENGEDTYQTNYDTTEDTNDDDVAGI